MRLFIFLALWVPMISTASVCETFTGTILKAELCFDAKIGGWISKRCLDDKDCGARKFFQKKVKVELPKLGGGQNPAASYCHKLKIPVVILKDINGNEQSLCQFEDETLVDSNAVERFLE